MDAQELIAQLREYASNPGYSHNDYADTMREAAGMLAERAVSPEESVDTPEFGLLIAKLELAATQIDHSQPTAPQYDVAFKATVNHIDAKIAAAHAEGRRSAMEELAKEKERADRAEADLKALQSLPAGEHPGCVELIRENHQQHCRVTHALMAERDQFKKNHAEVLLMLHSERIIRQAPDLSKLERYDVTYSGMDDSPDGAWVKFADVQALLAQPLQQEGGKGALIQAVDAVLRDALDAITVHPCDIHNYNVRAQCLAGPMAILYEARHAQTSNNLQQASTAQIEPTTKSLQDMIKPPCEVTPEDFGIPLEYSDRAISYHAYMCSHIELPSQATPEGAELPYGYVLRSNDGHETYFKKEPTAFKETEWKELVEIVPLYRAAPPQQKEPICCNHDCKQGDDCPLR